MKKKSSFEILKGVGIAYLVFAIIGVVLAIVMVAVPNLAAKFAPEDAANASVYAGVSILTSALLDFWHYWLIKRFLDKKSNGTLFMVLAALMVAGNVATLFGPGTESVNVINLALAAIGLFSMYKARQERKSMLG